MLLFLLPPPISVPPALLVPLVRGYFSGQLVPDAGHLHRVVQNILTGLKIDSAKHTQHSM
jgi:hypothetical protein